MNTSKKQSDQPVTQQQWAEGMEMIKDFFDTLVSRADGSDARMDNVEGKIDKMDVRIGKMDSRIGNVEGKIDKMDVRIGKMDSRIGNVEGKIDKMDSRIDNVEGKIDKMDVRIGKMDSRIGNVEGKIDKMEKRMDERDIRDEFNWKEQRRLNDEIIKKLDMHTEILESLDAKIRYQKDMPERLDHVETTTYDLQRRVTILEEDRTKTG